MPATEPTHVPTGAPRVYLHVGVPKTGTTFVQDVLWRGRSQLARAGVCYPLRRRGEHFAATMDVRRSSWGGRRNPQWEGTWHRLAQTVIDSGAQTSILSGELLAAADSDAVSRAVDEFPDHEVHVVLTVRDLARQLVSGWQEQVKHRVSVPLDDFVAGCVDDSADGERPRRLAANFWQLHDLPDVAGRWAEGVPADRLHLVIVPPAAAAAAPGAPGDAPRGTLWERFAAVVGVDPALGAVDTVRPNTSLDAASAEVLRRYNRTRATGVSQRDYDQVVRVLLAERVLAAADGPPLRLAARFVDVVHARAARMVRELDQAGYDVVGDLDDLIPDTEALNGAPQPVVGAAQLADVAVHASAGLVAELGPLERRLKSRHDREQGSARPPAGPADRSRGLAGPPRPAGDSVSGPPGPVYLHVGAPKTGTTFLQQVMWRNRGPLAEAGVRFTRRRYADHYHASIDLRRATADASAAAGAWDRVVADTLDWRQTSVISHELFAAARPADIDRALESLGRERVHVVYTVRDLWSLLGAEWQESTKHGRANSFDQYLRDVLERGSEGQVGRWFWSVHDPVDVLARWSRGLPPERVHVVTVPPAGGSPILLWERFAGLLGVDPGLAVTPDRRDNPSLGGAEVTFLRHLNERLGGRRHGVLPPGEYARFVKTLLAQGVLAQRPGKTTYAPPPDYFPLAKDFAERCTSGLREAGYSVVGDLDDLVPATPGLVRPDPDQTTPEEILEVGLDVLSGLVGEAVRMRAAHGIGSDAAAPRRPAGDQPERAAPPALGRRLGPRLVRRAGRRLAAAVRSRRVAISREDSTP